MLLGLCSGPRRSEAEDAPQPRGLQYPLCRVLNFYICSASMISYCSYSLYICFTCDSEATYEFEQVLTFQFTICSNSDNTIHTNLICAWQRTRRIKRIADIHTTL